MSSEPLDQPGNLISAHEKLPVLLKAAAILTFAGSAFILLISGITLYFWKDSSDNPLLPNDVQYFYLWTKLYACCAVLNSILCSAGVVCMLCKKLYGYWIYAFSQLIFLPFLIGVSLSTIKVLTVNHILYYLIIFICMAGFTLLYSLIKKRNKLLLQY